MATDLKFLLSFTVPDIHLTDTINSYSYTPSQADVHVFKTFSSEPSASEFPNSARWYKHIASYSAEHASLPGTSTAGEAFSKSTSAAAPAAAATEDDDDEVDLFGSDDDEDAEAERVKAERVAAYNAKKANKPKTIAKVRSCFTYFFLTIQSIILKYIFTISYFSRSSLSR